MSKTSTEGMAAQVRESLREIVAPLEDQLVDIDRRIKTLKLELSELRESRHMINLTLDRLVPERRTSIAESPQAKGAKALAAKKYAEKKAAVEKYLADHASELEDGFSKTELASYVTQIEPVSSTTMGPILDELRDAGMIRVDRKLKGGGIAYKIVASRNGGS